MDTNLSLNYLHQFSKISINQSGGALLINFLTKSNLEIPFLLPSKSRYEQCEEHKISVEFK